MTTRRRVAFAISTLTLAVLLTHGCRQIQRATEPTAAMAQAQPIPTCLDAGTVLTCNGVGLNPSWQSGALVNSSYPSTLPYFSPVSFLEAINANGDKLGGSTTGVFLSSNNAGSANAYTYGVGFYTFESGHVATGVRTYWLGDPTHETSTTLKCELWDYSAGTSIASGTVAVGMAAEATCTFTSGHTLVAAHPYVASIVDAGPCAPGGCALGATYMNDLNTDAVAGVMSNKGNVPILASPWLTFGNMLSTGGTVANGWFGLQSALTGDHLPSSPSTQASPVEPIVR